ncbi:hypothetical protein RFI_27531 [Reticulomyxa filosa]|uniref:Uncharacterized protein n=1 Tax=Reticulomyxa filosa TaxID=46433 RepID=X6M8P7_RETFI|nr:hypothetical protein RFI_27531 [Reticulomyxa filosa]|eukprot:ETO09847.1 hypothetical protein RFI_27531 [Reticulomyxa filosa]
MEENGPYHVQNDLSLTINNYSWTEQANVIWVDQPSQTGYSYDDKYVIDGVYNEDEVADDLYEFIQTFLQANPKYSKLNFYVTGESKKIFDMNKQLGPNDIYINLKGLAIGDGLVGNFFFFFFF